MKLPLAEIAKSIPGLLGIRLEEEPKFEVLIEDGDFQLRAYAPMVIAQVSSEGSWEEASDQNFERLAEYIFGGNKTSQQLSMTTPVLQNETLSMTTPVIQKQVGSSWSMTFVLPSDITLETAPVPLDSGIEVSLRPATKVATYRYSGTNTQEAMHDASMKLQLWVEEKNLNTVGQFHWAQYDQPFSIPFTKRNEAHIEVE